MMGNRFKSLGNAPPSPQMRPMQPGMPQQRPMPAQNFDQMLFRPGVKPAAPQPRGANQIDEIVMQLLRGRG